MKCLSTTTTVTKTTIFAYKKLTHTCMQKIHTRHSLNIYSVWITPFWRTCRCQDRVDSDWWLSWRMEQNKEEEEKLKKKTTKTNENENQWIFSLWSNIKVSNWNNLNIDSVNENEKWRTTTKILTKLVVILSVFFIRWKKFFFFHFFCYFLSSVNFHWY